MIATRREFLAAAGIAGAAVSLSPLGAFGAPRRMKPMRLLILGGTGFLGPHIVRTAIERGHEMTLFNRGRTNPELFPDLEKLQGDRDGDLKALEGRDWDAVIDTSAYYPRVVTDSATLLADHVRQYTLISTISVYASFDKLGITEDDPVGVLDDPTVETVSGLTYGPLKALCEQAAEKAMPGRVNVIRPGLIVGPGDTSDRFTYWPVRVAQGGEVLAPGTPDDPIQQIDVRDLAAFVIDAIERNVTGTYNATSPPDTRTMGDLMTACKSAAGSNATFTWVAADFLEANGVSAWQNMPAWIPPTGEMAGFGAINVERALAKGLSIRPLEQTCADTLAWARAEAPERLVGWGEGRKPGLSPEREREVLDLWKSTRPDGG